MIPARLQLQPINKALLQEMCELCDQIADELEKGGDAQELFERWHTHAYRKCEPDEFRNYWRAVDQKTFVRDALNPSAAFDPQVTFAEALAVLQGMRSVSESAKIHYLRWLEAQFPGSIISDLIYWPDEWFGDQSLFRDSSGAFKPDAKLTEEQILGYAMAKSGRKLADAPEIALPFPLPQS